MKKTTSRPAQSDLKKIIHQTRILSPGIGSIDFSGIGGKKTPSEEKKSTLQKISNTLNGIKSFFLSFGITPTKVLGIATLISFPVGGAILAGTAGLILGGLASVTAYFTYKFQYEQLDRDLRKKYDKLSESKKYTEKEIKTMRLIDKTLFAISTILSLASGTMVSLYLAIIPQSILTLPILAGTPNFIPAVLSGMGIFSFTNLIINFFFDRKTEKLRFNKESPDIVAFALITIIISGIGLVFGPIGLLLGAVPIALGAIFSQMSRVPARIRKISKGLEEMQDIITILVASLFLNAAILGSLLAFILGLSLQVAGAVFVGSLAGALFSLGVDKAYKLRQNFRKQTIRGILYAVIGVGVSTTTFAGLFIGGITGAAIAIAGIIAGFAAIFFPDYLDKRAYKKTESVKTEQVLDEFGTSNFFGRLLDLGGWIKEKTSGVKSSASLSSLLANLSLIIMIGFLVIGLISGFTTSNIIGMSTGLAGIFFFGGINTGIEQGKKFVGQIILGIETSFVGLGSFATILVGLYYGGTAGITTMLFGIAAGVFLTEYLRRTPDNKTKETKIQQISERRVKDEEAVSFIHNMPYFGIFIGAIITASTYILGFPATYDIGLIIIGLSAMASAAMKKGLRAALATGAIGLGLVLAYLWGIGPILAAEPAIPTGIAGILEIIYYALLIPSVMYGIAVLTPNKGRLQEIDHERGMAGNKQKENKKNLRENRERGLFSSEAGIVLAAFAGLYVVIYHSWVLNALINFAGQYIEIIIPLIGLAGFAFIITRKTSSKDKTKLEDSEGETHGLNEEGTSNFIGGTLALWSRLKDGFANVVDFFKFPAIQAEMEGKPYIPLSERRALGEAAKNTETQKIDKESGVSSVGAGLVLAGLVAAYAGFLVAGLFGAGLFIAGSGLLVGLAYLIHSYRVLKDNPGKTKDYSFKRQLAVFFVVPMVGFLLSLMGVSVLAYMAELLGYPGTVIAGIFSLIIPITGVSIAIGGAMADAEARQKVWDWKGLPPAITPIELISKIRLEGRLKKLEEKYPRLGKVFRENPVGLFKTLCGMYCDQSGNSPRHYVFDATYALTEIFGEDRIIEIIENSRKNREGLWSYQNMCYWLARQTPVSVSRKRIESQIKTEGIQVVIDSIKQDPAKFGLSINQKKDPSAEKTSQTKIDNERGAMGMIEGLIVTATVLATGLSAYLGFMNGQLASGLVVAFIAFGVGLFLFVISRDNRKAKEFKDSLETISPPRDTGLNYGSVNIKGKRISLTKRILNALRGEGRQGRNVLKILTIAPYVFFAGIIGYLGFSFGVLIPGLIGAGAVLVLGWSKFLSAGGESGVLSRFASYVRRDYSSYENKGLFFSRILLLGLIGVGTVYSLFDLSSGMAMIFFGSILSSLTSSFEATGRFFKDAPNRLAALVNTILVIILLIPAIFISIFVPSLVIDLGLRQIIPVENAFFMGIFITSTIVAALWSPGRILGFFNRIKNWYSGWSNDNKWLLITVGVILNIVLIAPLIGVGVASLLSPNNHALNVLIIGAIWIGGTIASMLWGFKARENIGKEKNVSTNNNKRLFSGLSNDTKWVLITMGVILNIVLFAPLIGVGVASLVSPNNPVLNVIIFTAIWGIGGIGSLLWGFKAREKIYAAPKSASLNPASEEKRIGILSRFVRLFDVVSAKFLDIFRDNFRFAREPYIPQTIDVVPQAVVIDDVEEAKTSLQHSPRKPVLEVVAGGRVKQIPARVPETISVIKTPREILEGVSRPVSLVNKHLRESAGSLWEARIKSSGFVEPLYTVFLPKKIEFSGIAGNILEEVEKAEDLVVRTINSGLMSPGHNWEAYHSSHRDDGLVILGELSDIKVDSRLSTLTDSPEDTLWLNEYFYGEIASDEVKSSGVGVEIVGNSLPYAALNSVSKKGFIHTGNYPLIEEYIAEIENLMHDRHPGWVMTGQRRKNIEAHLKQYFMLHELYELDGLISTDLFGRLNDNEPVPAGMVALYASHLNASEEDGGFNEYPPIRKALEKIGEEVGMEVKQLEDIIHSQGIVGVPEVSIKYDAHLIYGSDLDERIRNIDSKESTKSVTSQMTKSRVYIKEEAFNPVTMKQITQIRNKFEESVEKHGEMNLRANRELFQSSEVFYLIKTVAIMQDHKDRRYIQAFNALVRIINVVDGGSLEGDSLVKVVLELFEAHYPGIGEEIIRKNLKTTKNQNN